MLWKTVFYVYLHKEDNNVDYLPFLSSMKLKTYLIVLLLLACTFTSSFGQERTPRIVNIIKFIRGVESCLNGVVTPEILYETVAKQAEISDSRT